MVSPFLAGARSISGLGFVPVPRFWDQFSIRTVQVCGNGLWARGCGGVVDPGVGQAHLHLIMAWLPLLSVVLHRPLRLGLGVGIEVGIRKRGWLAGWLLSCYLYRDLPTLA